MRVVAENTKTPLRLIRLHMPGGRAVIRTGYAQNGEAIAGMTDWQRRELTRLGAERWDTCDNVIIEAALKPGKGNAFIDRDDGFSYEATPANTVRILKAAVEGKLRIEQGYIVGLFSFAQPGAIVSLVHHKGRAKAPKALKAPEPPQAAPAGAPDLSDFIRTLR